MTSATPVSDALVQQLRSAVGRKGVIIWLDRHRYFERLAAKLAADDALGAPLVVLDGSFLEAMLALEPHVRGADAEPLVVYLPGLLSAQVKATPLYEIAALGTEFSRALNTLVVEAARDRVPHEQVASYLGDGAATLEDADRWLAELLGSSAPEDEGLRDLSAAQLLRRLLDGGAAPSTAEAAYRRLSAQLGVTARWAEIVGRPEPDKHEDVAFVAGSWALAVEYVHDLTRAPRSEALTPLRSLPHALVSRCREACEQLRSAAPERYVLLADDSEELVRAGELPAPEDLGRIDTFAFEGETILVASLEALRTMDWDLARRWAADRLAPGAFWVQRDPARRLTWELVAAGARLGAALERASHPPVHRDHTTFVAWYRDTGATVDRAHRELEQQRASTLYPGRVAHYDALRDRLDWLRREYAGWAGHLANRWDDTCRRLGFLPPAELQQRRVFRDVVRPLVGEGDDKVALFLVDALRFEMAQALYDALANTPGAHAALDARLAELPTTSAVGMNALAPVWGHAPLAPVFNQGKIAGFSAGEFQVRGRDHRRRQMHELVGGARCPSLTLADLLSRDASGLRKAIAQSRLVVVFSKEIDDGGHAGSVGELERALQMLQGAWRLLREAGVKRFVFTADHGFLLLDQQNRTAQPRGKRGEHPLRCALARDAAEHPDELRIPLRELEYADPDGHHLVMPAGVAIFDPGERPTPFVHGGNSLQERVVPVLRVTHRTGSGAGEARYRISELSGETRPGGVHEVRFRLEPVAQQGLPFGRPPEVTLALEAEEPQVDLVVHQVEGRGARLDRTGIHVPVDVPVRVSFQLVGPSARRVRVRLVHRLGRAQVEVAETAVRFAVTSALTERAPSRTRAPEPAEEAPSETGSSSDTAWLEAFEDAGVRHVFELLAAHGSVDEGALVGLLGGPRRARRFAREIDAHVAKAPFGVKIDMASGKKRYLREGGA